MTSSATGNWRWPPTTAASIASSARKNATASCTSPPDFLSLKLPKETRNYVPKLLAMKHIISNPDSFGIVLSDIPNQPYFAAVTTSRHIDVNLAAELAGITLEDFKALNPGNSRPVILQDDSTRILIPAAKVELFMSNLESHDKPLVSWQAYQSKKGEPLEKVAARFGITVEQLRKANGLMPDTKVSNGQQLLVPDREDDPNKEFVAFNMHLAPTLDEGHAHASIPCAGRNAGQHRPALSRQRGVAQATQRRPQPHPPRPAPRHRGRQHRRAPAPSSLSPGQGRQVPQQGRFRIGRCGQRQVFLIQARTAATIIPALQCLRYRPYKWQCT